MPVTPSLAIPAAISMRSGIEAALTKRSWKRPPPGVKYQMPTENFSSKSRLRLASIASGVMAFF